MDIKKIVTREIEKMVKEHMTINIRELELVPGIPTKLIGLYWDKELISEVPLT